MYVLVMKPRAPIETSLLFSSGPSSELGSLRIAGTIRQSRGVIDMRILGSYALVYLARGSGIYRDARGITQRVGAGSLIWIFPELAHVYGPGPHETWDEIYFVFDGPMFDLWRRGILSPSRPVWRLDPVDFWFGRLEALARGMQTAGRESAFHGLSQFQALVAEMSMAIRGVEEEWLARSRRYLEAERATLDLEGLAKSLGMSYETFRKKFTDRMGTAPARYRQARQIDRACALLMQPALSNRQIAERLGFCDEFHFSKIFRKRMGFTPRTFRLKALGRPSSTYGQP